MKAPRLGLTALILMSLIAGTASFADASPLSSRVLRTQEALQAWMDSGAAKPLSLPVHLTETVLNLPAPGAAMAPGKEPALRLLVVADDPRGLRDAGFAVRTVAGEVATVSVPLSRLDELASVAGVRFADLPRRLEPSLNLSRSEVLADAAHGASAPPYPMTGATGRGVVVGTIDSGIDYRHEDFKNDDGSTRIDFIWDQTDNAGPNPSLYAYGTEWTPTQIDAGTARQKDLIGHGTHVAGIAAGNGRAFVEGQFPAYTFTGVAPEADIITVKTTFFEDAIIDAINYIQTRAGSRPSVVNLSLGGQAGPHDGTSPLDLAMRGLSGPGKIIAAAAGNDGDSDIHAEAVIAGGQSADMNFNIGSYNPRSGTENDVLIIEGWFPGEGNVRLTVLTPGGVSVGPIGPGDATSVSTSAGQVFLGQDVYNENNGRFFEVDVWDLGATPPAAGNWTIRVQNLAGTASVEMDAWISLNLVGSPRSNIVFTNNLDAGETLSSPGTSDSVLCVSAYVTKSNWPSAGGGTCRYQPEPELGVIAPFSARGPRRDGFAKPEVSAPGMGIASAKGQDALDPGFTQGCGVLGDNLHVVSQGTSQSSPHVAGAVALILEKHPTEAFKEISNRLIQTARSVATATGDAGLQQPVFDPAFGHGKLDVEAAVNLPVPVRLLSMSAAWEAGDAVIRWTLAETEPGARFVVARGPSKSGPMEPVSGTLTGGTVFAWTDPFPQAEKPWYEVRAMTRDGNVERLGQVRLDPLAARLELRQNAPNPFAAVTAIGFELDRPRDVRLEVFDVRGRLITTLREGLTEAGEHLVQWDGTESGGRAAAAGIYFYRLSTPESVKVQRMVLAR